MPSLWRAGPSLPARRGIQMELSINTNQSLNDVKKGDKVARRSAASHRKYARSVKGVEKPELTILRPVHEKAGNLCVDTLKTNIAQTSSKDWAKAVMESLCENMAIHVDVSLTSWNGKLISKRGDFSLYKTSEPEKIIGVPVQYANLYWDEIVSTAINRCMLVAEPGVGVCERLSRAVSRACADPMVKHIMNYKPHVTLRFPFTDTFPTDYSPIIKPFGVIKPNPYGFGCDVYLSPVPEWGTLRQRNYTLSTVANAMRTGVLPRDKRVGRIVEKYGFCYRYDQFDLKDIHRLSKDTRRIGNLWKFYSAAYSWAKLIDDKLGPPENYWCPSFFYSLQSNEHLATMEAYEEEPSSILGSVRDFVALPSTLRNLSNNIGQLPARIDQSNRIAAAYHPVASQATEEMHRFNNLAEDFMYKPKTTDFITDALLTPLKAVIPEEFLKFIDIDLPQLALNVYGAVSCKSKVAKAAFLAKMLKDAGAFELLKRAYHWVTCLRNNEEPTDDDGITGIWEWLTSLGKSPLQFAKTFFMATVGILSGFKRVGFIALSKAWTTVLRSCKNIHTLAQGATGITRIWEVIEKAVVAAKLFCNRHLGCKFDVVDMKKLVKVTTDMCEFLSKLAEPEICAAACADAELRKMFCEGFTALNRVRLDKNAQKNKVLTDLIKVTLDGLKNERLKLNMARVMNEPMLNPYSFLLMGEPGIGKSTILEDIVHRVAPKVGLNTSIYNMNADLTWMDGYLGHESWVFINDIFSTTLTPEVKFLLNLISPSAYIVPVAMNENRPTIFKTPVIIATSNTPYTQAKELTSPQAVDRRFPKWEVTIDPECYDHEAKCLLPEKVNEKGGVTKVYTFTERPTLADKPLKNPRTYDYLGFVKMLEETILKHLANQVRISKWTPTQVRVNECVLNQLGRVVNPDVLERINTTAYDINTIYRNVQRILEVDTPAPTETAQPVQEDPEDEDVEVYAETPGPSGINNNDDDDSDVEDEEPTYDVETDNARARNNRVLNIPARPQNPPQIPPLAADIELHIRRENPTLAQRFDAWFVRDDGLLVRTEEAEQLDFTFGINGPNVPVWDEGLAVDYEEEHFMVEAAGERVRIPTRILIDLQFIDGAWRMPLYYDHLPYPNARNENTRATAHQIDAGLIRFHNWWFAQTPRTRQAFHNKMEMITKYQNLHYVVRLRRQIAMLSRDAFRAIQPPMIMFANVVGLSVLVSLCYVIFIAITYTAMYLVLDFLIPIQEEPTSQYTPKEIVRGKTKAADFQTPTTGLESTQTVLNSKVKIMSNTFAARVRAGPNTWHAFNILGVKQNFYAFPKHSIYNKPLQEGVLEVQICSRAISDSRRDVWVSYYVRESDICHVKKRDISIVRISDRSMVPNLTQLMPEDHVDPGSGLHVVQISHRGGVFTEMQTVIVGYSDKVRLKTEYATIEVRDGLVTADPHQQGNSGGPSVCLDNKIQQRLLGLMSSTQSQYSYSTVTPFIRSEILEAINSLNPNIPEPTVEVATIEEIAEAPIIGTTKEKVSTPLKTSLTRTPLYGVIGVSSAVPVLHPKLGDALSDGRFKTEKVTLRSLEPSTLNQIVSELGCYYRMVIHNNYRRMPVARNMEHAVTGKYIGGKHIELSTSPGIGQGKWMFGREKSGKHDFIEINEDGSLKYLCPRLIDVTTKQIRTHLTGRVCDTAFAQFPKDELRPIGKAPRSIDGSPLEDQIEYRMLFGEFDGMLNNCPKVITRSAVGIDLQNAEGDELARILTNTLHRAFVYDVKKWDANITLQLWNADAEVVNYVYNDSFQLARKMLLRQTCLAPIVSGDYVIQPGKGMRSGYPGTANTNTRIHLLLIIYCVKQIMRRRTNKEPTLEEVFNAVFFLSYADDIVGCVTDPYWFDYIDGRAIADEMTQLGFDVVDPDGKNTLVKPVSSVQEINFLKHQPVYSVDLDRFIWRIDIASVQNCCNYTSGPDFTESLDSIFYHAYPFGRKFYDNLRTLVNERLLSHNIQYVTTFDMMTGKWAKKVETSVQPIIRFVAEDFWEEG